MARKPYPTDVTDAEWSFVVTYLALMKEDAPQRTHDLREVFKNKPLPMHPQAMPAASWFEAARLQSPEKSWAFHDKLFQNQDKLGEPFYRETAKALGLDADKLAKDAASQAVKDAIAADVKEAEEFKFEGTPGFLLNGIPIRGAYPVEHFDEIIQKLQAAKGAK